MKLRPHQKKQNKLVRKALKKQDHILFGASTGFGKSVCILDFVRREIDKGGRVLVIAPRRKLVWQLMGTFKEEQPALLMGSDSRGNTRTAPLIVASLNTLHRRLERGGRNVLSDITKIIIDEVHISFNMPGGVPSLSASKLHELYWDIVKWVGFTATPITAGGYRLEGWDETVYKYDAAWLIKEGWLAKFDYYSEPAVDVRNLKVQSSTGDFSVSDMEEVTNTATSIQSVIDNYKKYGSSTKTLIFAASIVHAELIAEGFSDDDIEGVRVIHSNLSEAEQEKILEEYKYNSISILINVAMLTTGFDDPEVETLIIARPIGSVRLALQVYGRSLRQHDNIPTVTILDLCSVWDTTGILPDMTPNWNRKKKKRGDLEAKEENSIEDIVWECEVCRQVFQMINAQRATETTKEIMTTTYYCPHCGGIARVDTKDLSIPEIEKIKTVSDIDYSVRVYNGKEVIEIVAKLITLNTQKAKTSWAYYIHKKCILVNQKAYREIIYGYEQEIFTPSRAWKRMMELYNA